MAPERLTSDGQSALLRGIGVDREHVSLEYLARLQRAWCLAQPFHNLDLLAAIVTGAEPLGPAAALDRCMRGLGGPCHVQSFGLLALLQSLGFDAHLCGANVNHPDDHLVVRVIVDGGAYVCDVGNGQPYLHPFPTDRELRQEHLGWIVVSRPLDGGVAVERSSPDQPSPRRVYWASAQVRRWQDFFETIWRHHTQSGYGPFMTGLRAVRIGAAEMVTVRDHVVTRYDAGGFQKTTLDRFELSRFLRADLGLGELPIDDAFRAWTP